MHRLLVASLLATPGLAFAQGGPPGGGAVTLDVAPTLVAGERASLVADGVAPGATAHLFVSLRDGGALACPPALGGDCLDLYAPAIDLGRRDEAGGGATWDLSIPESASGDVTFQVVVAGGREPAFSAPVGSTVVGDDPVDPGVCDYLAPEIAALLDLPETPHRYAD